jgi:hypothetical protein
MTTGKRKAKRDVGPLTVIVADGADVNTAIARTKLRPSVNAALTLKQAHRELGDTDVQALVDELTVQARTVIDGDLGRLEGMLATQATTLDALFGILTRRALMNMGDHLDATEAYMRLAFRAQAQARATVAALGELKNPKPLAFVQQANIANGPQQVNNGAAETVVLDLAQRLEDPKITLEGRCCFGEPS